MMTAARANTAWLALAGAAWFLAAGLQTLQAQPLDLSWYTIDGGGGVSSAGGAYVLSGTIGQHDVSTEPAAGGDYQLTGGFWTAATPVCSATSPADFDQDCDVDADDLAAFVSCVSGPEVLMSDTPACQPADFDSDGDIDQADYGVFQQCYSGQGIAAEPTCAD